MDDLNFRLGFWRMIRDLSEHVTVHGRFTHMIVLPFFARGGAEATAAHFCRAVVQAGHGRPLLVAADRTLQNADRFPTPEKVFALDLSDYFPDADLKARESLLLGVLRIAGPDVFHIINSEVAWHLLLKAPERVKAVSRTFASIFAFQFDPITREKVGYASTFLRAGLPHLDGLLSDNHRFIADACREYGLHSEVSRMAHLYNPCEMLENADSSARIRLDEIQTTIARAARFQVLWAGRLDAEKRIDLIEKVARLCPEMDFHIHGTRVVDASVAMPDLSLPNVKQHGPFASPLDVIARSEGHALMFTSRWEGLPNILLEFGSLGTPIVAATVGGVGELIDETTGYPLREDASPEDYAAALRLLFASPEEAQRRARALFDRLRERHSFDAFLSSVRSIPHYLASGMH